MDNKLICPWARKDPLLRRYHDERWGRKVKDDQELFALLELESLSVGLSWRLILSKEELLRSAFDSFDPMLCSQEGDDKVEQLLALKGMIHHRKKIESVFHNARCFLLIVKEYGSFLPYLEQIAGERKDNHLTAEDRLPTVSKESVLLSKDMKRRGFLYLGPVILYSYLQAVGLVDDHLLSCPFHGIE